LIVVWNGPGEKGPPIFVLNNTTDELVPVFHEYLTLGPPTVFTETRETVPLHASNGAAGVPTVLEGGAALTKTVKEAHDELPQPSSIRA
jgi:hypothetical protein